MTVRVRFFASLRERLRTSEASRELSPGATVDDLLRTLRAEFPDLASSGRVSIAVNAEYVDARHPLSDGDEVALIPPVSGGCRTLVPSA
ncbi:molybdopterin converting factor subunit 1 [Candidatus Binatia bacterium]|nr:molybdopterin converting factor subunit 1 [Candidatus Binatia bacterium]